MTKTLLPTLIVFVFASLCSLSVARRPHVSLESVVSRSEIIFEGTLTGLSRKSLPATFKYGSGQGYEMSFKVTKLWKGKLPRPALIYMIALKDQPCTNPIEPKLGNPYLVIPSRVSSGIYEANRCMNTLFNKESLSAKEFTKILSRKSQKPVPKQRKK